MLVLSWRHQNTFIHMFQQNNWNQKNGSFIVLCLCSFYLFCCWKLSPSSCWTSRKTWVISWSSKRVELFNYIPKTGSSLRARVDSANLNKCKIHLWASKYTDLIGDISSGFLNSGNSPDMTVSLSLVCSEWKILLLFQQTPLCWDCLFF